MPPRARKTAAAKPAADDSGLLPQEPVTEEPNQPVPEAEAGADVQPPELPAPDEVTAELPVEPPAVAEPALPAAPTSHWELAVRPGVESSPCRLCLPGGPPDGAGSIGCQHGQWVCVWDGA